MYKRVHPPYRLSADLTNGSTTCLAKALLGSVCSDQNAHQIYKTYFDFYTLADADTNLSCIKSRPNLTQKVTNSMFKLKRPQESPVFFSFDSHHDLSRLAALVKKEIVIYGCGSEKSLDKIQCFHDFRILSSGYEKPVVYYLVTRAKTLFQVDRDLDFLLSYELPKTSDSCYLYSNLVDCIESTLAEGLSQLTGLARPEHDLQSIPDSLQDCRQELYQLWGEPVLFVALCKTFNFSWSNQHKIKKTSSHHFVTLALVGPRLQQLSHLDIESISKVVCFLGGTKKICLLKGDFKKHVLSQLVRTAHKDKAADRDLLKLVRPNKEAVKKAQEHKRNSKKKYTSRAELKGRLCKCEICTEPSYNYNMNKCGPERLLTYNLDVTELLGLLGINTPENIVLVEKMCELSVASMDIESMTLDLDLERPVDPSTGVEHSVVDGVTLEGHMQKIQKPVMIAHLDGAMENLDPQVFVVDSDSEEDIYKMMVDYWNFVKVRRDQCTELKKSLAEPIQTILQSYCLKHNQFYINYSEDLSDDRGKPDIGGSWRRSVPGQLQLALSRLISNYAVFSFYGLVSC